MRRRKEENRLVLVGHLEIDFEMKVIAYAGTPWRFRLTSSILAHLERRLQQRALL